MDYSSRINTSLDLNINPHSHSLSLHHQHFPSSGGGGGESLVEELKRVSAENNKLSKMLTEMCENYNTLRSNLIEYMRNNPPPHHIHTSSSKKRKSESSNIIPMGNSESSSTDQQSCKKPTQHIINPKISRLYVRTQPSDTTTLIVKDGYQWRKYGQKVTRDNPSPRAYFKCSFAPTCPVKKKVQTSVEDQSVVVATYEGEHNHPLPSQIMEPTATSSRCMTLDSVPCSASLTSSAPTLTLDWTKSKCSSNDSNNTNPKIKSPEVPQILVEQMATSLTKDPNFRAALVAAISGKMLHKN